jgi:hypothetical protein
MKAETKMSKKGKGRADVLRCSFEHHQLHDRASSSTDQKMRLVANHMTIIILPYRRNNTCARIQ